MILAKIKHYLSSQHSVTLNDLSIHFDTDPEALRDMLQLWVKKGKIKIIQTEGRCVGKCGKCTCASIETYQWVQSQAIRPVQKVKPLFDERDTYLLTLKLADSNK